ncbi:MAG: hypothetical protein NT023_12615 [Armatimonadetes bacterium]|nr:hypothetical protein [Armatimonadota bacterium]
MKGFIWQSAACVSLLWIVGMGCMEDTKGTYKAVADRNGELVPGDMSQRSFTKVPNPDSDELTPATKSNMPGGNRGAISISKEIKKEYYGIPTYPNMHFADGFGSGRSIMAEGMHQVILETKDPASVVDAFFTQNLPDAHRSEMKLANGTGVTYLLPFKEGVSRSVAITPTMDDKTLITYGKIEDAATSAASATAEKATRLPTTKPIVPFHRTSPLPGGGFDKPSTNSIPPPPAGLNPSPEVKTTP